MAPPGVPGSKWAEQRLVVKLAVGETVISLAPSLSFPTETPIGTGAGLVQQADSRAGGYRRGADLHLRLPGLLLLLRQRPGMGARKPLGPVPPFSRMRREWGLQDACGWERNQTEDISGRD